MSTSPLLKFTNCLILRDHKIVREDLWVRNGKIVDPEEIFFINKELPDQVINCKGAIIAPGFIDLQINGGYGIDFSFDTASVKVGVDKVGKELLSHGVTSFCPTLVTSPPETYHMVLPQIQMRKGGQHGATILGVHIEGPFINKEKKGAHPIECIKSFEEGFKTALNVYGSLENVRIVTLAPELDKSDEVINEMVSRGITVSVGHSMADLADGERAVCAGATFITHLFNAMLPFHHRDPGLVGLLASKAIPCGKQIYFGIIADGIHTHPAALRIAHRTHPDGLVLVSDAISALGLSEGLHHIGQMEIEVRGGRAYVAGTNTLCGSTSALDYCVRIFKEATNCSVEYALEAASLHAAQTIGIANKKGSLSFGADADFVFLDQDLNVCSTWIAGECVYSTGDKHIIL